MMSLRIRAAFSIILFFGIWQPAISSTVILDTTEISFWTIGGSTPTVVGAWSTNPLVLPTGATIDYFTVEITKIISNFGRPQTIEFTGNGAGLIFCFNTLVCVADTFVGDITSIDINSFAWNFMNRLIDGNPSLTISGGALISYSLGGVAAVPSGTIAVNLYGQATPIPIPATIWLFSSALGLLGWLRYRLS